MKTLHMYEVEFPDHDYDTINGAVIMAYTPDEAKRIFIEQCNPAAARGTLEVTNVSKRLLVPGVVHTEDHPG